MFDDASNGVAKMKLAHYFRQSIFVNISVVAGSGGGSQHFGGGFYLELS